MPEGHKEWSEKAKKIIAQHPEVFNTPEGEVPHDENKHVKVTKGGRQFVVSKVEQMVDDLKDEWDDEEATVGFSAGGMTEAEEAKDQSRHDLKRPGSDVKTVNLDPEPVLTADQYVSFGVGSLGASWADGIIESSRLRTRLVLD